MCLRKSLFTIFFCLIAFVACTSPAQMSANPPHVPEKIRSPEHLEGDLLFLRGEYKKAIPFFKKVLEKEPNNDEVLFNLGVSYGKLGLHRDAIEAFKQAIRIKPDAAKAHFNLGLAYLGIGNKGAALDEYKILKDIDKDKANKLFNLIYK
ncbi:MAG: tetratricopeptide repeat protein [Desulfatiglandales bacterium]|nr:tetratricopeptide repeat protein [Desulfatiglandales bacterium]